MPFWCGEYIRGGNKSLLTENAWPAKFMRPALALIPHTKNYASSMLQGYFSYIRVSTQRQGQKGTSLTEQAAAIDRYANTWKLNIVKRFEERETAAKQGRPVFLEMVKALKNRKARGVIIHKIDRSARNLRDWAELGSLIDLGVEVHFANESLDLNSRGGRLSADIQAVVASDYIRNLREETMKGMRGRIKQGFYPLPAPLGYIDRGAAKAKDLDPVRAPLLRRAFELYSTGRFSLASLSDEMHQLGLRNRNGGKLTKTAFNSCLRNPFYMGLVSLRSMSESFVGQHKALVSRSLFDQVQTVLSGKSVKKTNKHFFIFRRHVSCGGCSNHLVPERQKGHVYYRCHTRSCEQPPIKEELIVKEFIGVLKRIEFTEAEILYFRSTIERLKVTEPERRKQQKEQIALRLGQIESRLDRLTDAYMDGLFDRETYERKRETLLEEKLELGEQSQQGEHETLDAITKLDEFLELAKSAYLSFKTANEGERRDLVKTISSNIIAKDKLLITKLNSPFREVSNRGSGSSGGPFRDTFRTNSALISQIFDFFLAGGLLRRGSSSQKSPASAY